MSDPAANISDPRGDFLSARSGAAQPSDAWMLALAGGATSGSQTAQPGAPSPSAAPPASPGTALPGTEPSQPFGLRVSNMLRNAASSAATTVKGDMAGSWDQLKKDFVGATGMSPQMQQAFHGGSFWDQMKAQWDSQVAGGKLPWDAFKTAISPLTGTADAATGAVAHAAFKVLPQEPGYGEKEFHDDLNTALATVMPEGGELEGAAAKAGEGGGVQGAPAVAKPAAAGTVEPPENSPAGAAPSASGNEPPKQAFDLEGQEPGSALKVTPEVRQQAADFLAGKRDNPVQVHLDMLADPATRGEVVNQVAKIIPKDGVKPLDVTMMGAYSLNMQPEEVMATLRPQFASDDKFAAAAMTINSAGKAFWDLATKANDSGAPEDVEAATRAFAQFNDFVGSFRQAKTDWGRAGRIQQEVQESFDPYTQHIMKVAQDLGTDNFEEVIRKTAALEDPAKVSPWVSTMRWMGSRDGMLYGWYNYLLSNPATVAKKLTSDMSIGLWNVSTRLAAEKFGSGAVPQGEALNLFNGYVSSMGDAVRAAGKALKAGQSQFYGDYQSLFDGRVLARNTTLAKLTPENALGPSQAALEYLKMAMPTSWIGAADDFAKVANYRAELHALTWRRAQSDWEMRQAAIKNGAPAEGNVPTFGSVAEHQRYLLANVPDDLHDQAVSAALKNTLSEPLEGVGQAVQDLIDKVNIGEFPLGRMIVPFTKIATNVARMAYRNSPIGYAPWLRSQALRNELAAGGARRDIAQAQMGLGSAMALAIGSLVMAGKITGGGPSDPGLQRARRNVGIPPDSIHIGNSWYSYNRVEPIATTIGTIADTFELMHYAHEQDNAQLATSLVLGVGHAMMSKTYLGGISNFLDALNSPDRDGARWADNLISSMAMPQGASGLENTFDPWIREHKGLLQDIQARTPGWAEKLPPARDIWGDPLPRQQGFAPILDDEAGGQAAANLLSPIRVTPDSKSANPIDKWIWNNRDFFPTGTGGTPQLPAGPGQVMAQDDVKVRLSPQQLDRLKVLAGNGVKEPSTGFGAKDYLNALVQGQLPNQGIQQQWNGATPERRALMVGSIWNEFRTRAKYQLQIEDGSLRDTLTAAAQARAQKLVAPTIGAGP